MADKVVIVGGGFGGISVAKQLTSSAFDVTLIDKTNHHLFQPLLYQVATAALSPGDIALPIRSVFTNQRNLKVVLGEVVTIDSTSNIITLKNGNEVPFDYLVLAPGAQYNYFGNSSWEGHAPGLKTLSNALKLRENILLSLERAEQLPSVIEREPYLTYVVIGGGPTGVEMAGAIAEIAKRNMMRDFRNFNSGETTIYLIEGASKVLNGYPESLSEIALRDLRKMGVKVLLNSPVQEITANGVQLKDKFIKSPNVIWAAGVSASPILKSLNHELDRAGRVKVGKDLSLQDSPNIFVIGDAAYVEDSNGKPLPGIAPVALQQGKFVGKLIRNELKDKVRTDFKYVDKGSMATIGRAKAVANIRGLKFSGFFAWILWGFIHVFFLIGFRNRIRVFVEWIWYYITFKRGVRLITSDDSEISDMGLDSE
ncbi:MAG: NAD(P)/FAD-dependent oxidoreductase [Balneolaceae bacterium]